MTGSVGDLRGDLAQHAISRRERILGWLFVAACGAFYTAWMFRIAPGNAPDESMRYLIVRYIVDHGSLPVGSDPAIRDSFWGTSYAYQPILSYMVGAVFALLAAALGFGEAGQFYAARFVSVVCGTGLVAVSTALGRRFFGPPWRWFFPLTVALIPQVAFLSAYVNNDSFGLLASALVVLAWHRGLEQGWSKRNALLLGISLTACTLSYFNTYGFLILSLVVCFGERLITWRRTQDQREFWRVTGVAVGIVVGTWTLLASWWFIRNGLLYQGDFLGLASSNASIETYGHPDSHAAVRSGQGRGWSMLHMLVNERWIWGTLVSSVGMFGYMTQTLPISFYIWYAVMWGLGGVGCLLLGVSWMAQWRRRRVPSAGSRSRVLATLDSPRRTLLLWAFVAASAIPWGLSLYRSWTQDYQAQGRYVMPMLIPATFFMVWGLSWLADRIAPRHQRWVAIALLLPVAAITVYTYRWVVS